MNNKNYTPHPIDTKDVTLSDDLMALAELIAENVHNVWAQSRLDNGWTYGPTRNDEKKETPCLVEYDELTEEEKSYDRDTAMETLKLIQKLGFKISRE